MGEMEEKDGANLPLLYSFFPHSVFLHLGNLPKVPATAQKSTV